MNYEIYRYETGLVVKRFTYPGTNVILELFHSWETNKCAPIKMRTIESKIAARAYDTNEVFEFSVLETIVID